MKLCSKLSLQSEPKLAIFWARVNGSFSFKRKIPTLRLYSLRSSAQTRWYWLKLEPNYIWQLISQQYLQFRLQPQDFLLLYRKIVSVYTKRKALHRIYSDLKVCFIFVVYEQISNGITIAQILDYCDNSIFTEVSLRK